MNSSLRAATGTFVTGKCIDGTLREILHVFGIKLRIQENTDE
jgi:hypothetical protein